GGEPHPPRGESQPAGATQVRSRADRPHRVDPRSGGAVRSEAARADLAFGSATQSGDGTHGFRTGSTWTYPPGQGRFARHVRKPEGAQQPAGQIDRRSNSARTEPSGTDRLLPGPEIPARVGARYLAGARMGHLRLRPTA